jgi:dihydrofolate reductase
MANTLYMTVSRDGFIAGPNDETPWSKESWQEFKKFVRSCDAVLLGKKTFKIMQAASEFVAGPEYFVATTDASLNTGEMRKVLITSAADIPMVAKLGIIGGGDLNGRLAKLNVINEVVLDEQAVDLHAGTRLFGTHSVNLSLQLLDERQISEINTWRHYRAQGSQDALASSHVS